MSGVVDLTTSDDEVEVIYESSKRAPSNSASNFDMKRSRTTYYEPLSVTYGQEVSFSLLSKNKVEMKWTGVGPPAKHVVEYMNMILKGFKGVQLITKENEEKARFAVEARLYNELLNNMTKMGVDTKQLPQQARNALTLGSDSDKNDTESLTAEHKQALEESLPEALVHSLADFQKIGVYWGAVTMKGRCLIADEPGLGKTIQSIGVALFFLQEWPLLVITPSSARYHWEHEVVKWTNDPASESVDPSRVQVLTSSSKPIQPGVQVLIVSYDLMDRSKKAINEFNGGAGFKVIIADECHMLKNQSTKRAKAILPMLRRAERAILLSGTPALSRPKELWSQLNVISPDQWPELKTFVNRYCRSEREEERANSNAASNMSELHTLLTETCMIRRLKVEILSSLPPKSRHMVRLPIDSESERESMKKDLIELLHQSSKRRSKRDGSGAKQHKSILDAALRSNTSATMNEAMQEVAQRREEERSEPSEEDTMDGRELAQRRKSLLMQMFKRTGSAKIPAIARHIAAVLDDPACPKFLVFAHHHEVLNSLESSVLRGVSHIRIDGKTNAKERQNRINRFQEDPKIRVALLGITAAGVAITLTAASLVLFTELFWTPAALLQAEDRAHRIGQTSAVRVEYLVSECSVDDILWPLIQEKMRVLGEVMEGKSDATMEVVDDEVEGIVEELAKEDLDRPVDADESEESFVGYSDPDVEIIEPPPDPNRPPVWRPPHLFRSSSMPQQSRPSMSSGVKRERTNFDMSHQQYEVMRQQLGLTERSATIVPRNTVQQQQYSAAAEVPSMPMSYSQFSQQPAAAGAQGYSYTPGQQQHQPPPLLTAATATAAAPMMRPPSLTADTCPQPPPLAYGGSPAQAPPLTSSFSHIHQPPPLTSVAPPSLVYGNGYAPPPSMMGHRGGENT